MTDRNAAIIGETAARLMDKVDVDVENGSLGDDARVVNVMVVVEIDHHIDGKSISSVSVNTHDPSYTVQLGLVHRAVEAVALGTVEDDSEE